MNTANAHSWTPWAVGKVVFPPSTNPQARAIPQAANDNTPRIIALTGLAGSGKSTAADYLIAVHGFTRVRFAGPLKAMMRALGLSDRHIEGDMKEVPHEMLCGKTPRQAMQTLGTEWGRKLIGDDFWINTWHQDAGRHSRVVVDDCRFPNEAAAVRKLGGEVWRIEGRGGIAGNHASEVGCGYAEVVIDNSGERAALQAAVDGALLAWNKAGGRVIKGLTKRRETERALCLEGLKA